MNVAILTSRVVYYLRGSGGFYDFVNPLKEGTEMATVVWKGVADPIAQVDKFTPSAPAGAGETYDLIVNTKVIRYTSIAGDGVKEVIDGLVAAWNGSTFAETDDADASNNADTDLRLTAATAGWPFIVTSAASPGTLTKASVTASSGPNHVDDPDNYDPSGIPAVNDTLIVAEGASDMLHGLDGLVNGLTKTTFRNITVGLPEVNSAGYYEYRPRHLSLNSSKVTVLSGLVRLDIGGNAADVTFEGPATGELKNTAIGSDLVVGGGALVELNSGPTDTGTVDTITAKEGTVNVREGSTVTSATIGEGARIVTEVSFSGTVTMHGGEFDVSLDGGANAIDCQGPGRIRYKSASSLNDLTLDHPYAEFDASELLAPLTITTAAIIRGLLRDPNGMISFGTLSAGKILVATE